MRRIIKNKKGVSVSASEEPPVDFVSYLLMALICLVFIFLSNTSNAGFKAEIEASVTDMNVEENLLSYLRYKVDYEGEQISMADLIVEAYYRDDYVYLESISKPLLEEMPAPHSAAGWNMRLLIMPEEDELHFIETYNIIGFYESKKLHFDIPLPDGLTYLRIELVLECEDKSCYEI